MPSEQDKPDSWINQGCFIDQLYFIPDVFILNILSRFHDPLRESLKKTGTVALQTVVLPSLAIKRFVTLYAATGPPEPTHPTDQESPDPPEEPGYEYR